HNNIWNITFTSALTKSPQSIAKGSFTWNSLHPNHMDSLTFHCFSCREAIQIRLGVHNVHVHYEDEQIRVPKEKLCCLSTKNCTQWSQDIMLIRLNSSVKNSEHIAPLSLPSSPPGMGSVCSVMGWGTITSPKGRDLWLYFQTKLLM
uniref:Peptidase S1 domain-containing protein n=1 Tax=Laticauda laticaudata TaxID=8630 RepID=A0A8C5RZH1_LATLA